MVERAVVRSLHLDWHQKYVVDALCGNSFLSGPGSENVRCAGGRVP